MRVLYVINSLGRGGAELNLVRLAARVREASVDAEIIPLRGGHPDVLAEARVRGVPVRTGALASLLGAVASRTRPDVVEGWQYAGALAATLFRARGVPVRWNFRHVPLDLREESASTRAALRALRHAPRPACIVVNSAAAVAAHRALGIDGEYRVIANGVDTERFVADAEAGVALRTSLGIPSSAFLLAHVARFHPHKGHAVLLAALAALPANGADVRLLCVGDGVSAVDTLAQRLGADRRRVYVADAMADLRPVYSAADVVVSPSLTESFPTVVAEAMSCARPCIATDVGDSAVLVHDCGRVVPAGSVEALRDAICDVAGGSAATRAEAGRRARARIVNHFSESIAVRTHLESLADSARRHD
jgi:glycosyltransferase involved in cell wall biosynthesis